ncbi:MAG: alpha/beta hydrolase [Lacisediminimonas sp.]|nr:alpha/beta hydrolase [Lacisediminimonas sp.]
MTAPITENQFATLSNGTRLHYASAGDPARPLILFLHGFPEFWFEWQAQLAEFGHDWHAVAPDLRGFNLSDQPSAVSAYRARHIAEDLRLLIGHLGAKQCVLVAHDWGGAIAWNMAISWPDLFSRMVIINAPHPYLFAQALMHDRLQQQASAYMNFLRKPGVEALLAENDFARLEALLSGMGQPAAGWFDGAVRERYRENWRRGLTGGVNYYRASPLYPPVDGDPGPAALTLDPEDFRVRVKTLVIWGEKDVALSTRLLEGLALFVDQLEIVRVPEGSHWVVHEEPVLVNSLIRGFLL